MTPHLIDLHLHTTASDGRCTPRALVAAAAAGGVSVMAVTDHDTTDAMVEARAAAGEAAIDVVAGIEVTAVEDGRDLHILGYFVDPDHAALGAFLAAQRASRLCRVEAIAERLASLGMPIAAAPLLEKARLQPGRSIGRPQIARAMVDAGHVADAREAFDRWLGGDRPAFVARSGPGPEAVIDVIHRAGGLASLAHPGKSRVESRIRGLREAGLDALEVFHPDHDAALVDHYARLAADLNCLMTGGSDFHGDPGHGAPPGSVSLPQSHWERLRDHPRPHASR